MFLASDIILFKIVLASPMDTDTGEVGACPGWEELGEGVNWGERRHLDKKINKKK